MGEDSKFFKFIQNMGEFFRNLKDNNQITLNKINDFFVNVKESFEKGFTKKDENTDILKNTED